jgi:hypothetical protein
MWQLLGIRLGQPSPDKASLNLRAQSRAHLEAIAVVVSRSLPHDLVRRGKTILLIERGVSARASGHEVAFAFGIKRST